jgi:5'-nucleotidase
MISRRKFLHQSIATSSILLLQNSPLSVFADDGYDDEEEDIKITILHTNDWHSRIEPFAMDGSRWQGAGGAARRATLIKQLRLAEKNILLLDAGDIFQGTPYFNFFHGELEYKLMSYMGYDACTLGNHDFDAGLIGIYNQLPKANFPFLIANYDFGNTILRNAFQPYKIFNKQGIKIGVFGIGIELNSLVPDALYGNTIYREPIAVANETAKHLKKNEKCDLIICLSHLGYKYNDIKTSDITLAKNSKDIDLIIGGHTHTFLDAPDVQKNLDGKDVLINQVGWAGLNLGKIDFYFSNRKIKNNVKSNTVIIK